MDLNSTLEGLLRLKAPERNVSVFVLRIVRLLRLSSCSEEITVAAIAQSVAEKICSHFEYVQFTAPA